MRPLLKDAFAVLLPQELIHSVLKRRSGRGFAGARRGRTGFRRVSGRARTRRRSRRGRRWRRRLRCVMWQRGRRRHFDITRDKTDLKNGPSINCGLINSFYFNPHYLDNLITSSSPYFFGQTVVDS